MTVRELTVGNVPGPGIAGHLRRRARLGALLPGRVRARPLARSLGGGGTPRDCRRRLRAIDSLRLEKGYRSGVPTSRPTRRRTRAGSGSASSSRSRTASSVVRRWRKRSGAAHGRGSAVLTLADPRSVALGSEPVRVEGEIAGRVTSGGYGYTVERSIAYAYLPPDQAEPGMAVEVEIFGEWVPGEVAASPSSTRAASGSASRASGEAGAWPGGGSARGRSDGAVRSASRSSAARSRRAGSPERGTPARW